MTALLVQEQVAWWAQWELVSAEQLPGVLPKRQALMCAEDFVSATQWAVGDTRQGALVRADTSEARLGDTDQMLAGAWHQGDMSPLRELGEVWAELQQTQRLHPVPDRSVPVQDLACCAGGRAGRKVLLLELLD